MRDAAACLERGELWLVDVREPDEWRDGRAPSAELVPLADLAERLPEIAAADRRVAFICHSGVRSAYACLAAEPFGIRAVNVQGGMVAWHAAALPMISG